MKKKTPHSKKKLVFHVAGWYRTSRELQKQRRTISSLVLPSKFLLLLRSNENGPKRRSLIQFPLPKQLPGYKIVPDFYRFRYTYYTASIHPYGVFEVKRATHGTRPTLFNSEVGRSRHRHAPGSVDRPESQRKRENRLTSHASLLPKL